MDRQAALAVLARQAGQLRDIYDDTVAMLNKKRDQRSELIEQLADGTTCEATQALLLKECARLDVTIVDLVDAADILRDQYATIVQEHANHLRHDATAGELLAPLD